MCTLGRCYAPRIMTLLRLPPVLSHFHSKFEVDTIDEFTSQLMQKKMDKWEQKKRQNEAFIDNNSTKLEVKSLNHRDERKLDNLQNQFQDLIESDDTKEILELTSACIDQNHAIPLPLLLNIFPVCSQNGEKEMVINLQKLCKYHYPEFSAENSDFKYFLAEAVWIKGDISRGLEIFENVYRENAYLRRRIRLMLKCLATDLVTKGSEASLGNMIHFSERIIRDFQDYVPISYIWQACFLSEWFSDQTIALELLEKHVGLCKSVVNRIPYVVFMSLKCDRTEVVYRLLEILLRNKMKQQYSTVLGALLDYQFRFGDLARCAEIIKWSVEHDLPLPQKISIKFINKILNQKMNTPLAPMEKMKEGEYEFKF